MKLIYLFIAILLSHVIIAQTTGGVRGLISDQYNQLPLVGVSILVDGPQKKTAITDAKGYFIINNVHLGRYDIIFSFVGYEPVVISNVEISGIQQLELNISMQESITDLDEIVVKSEKTGGIKSEFATVSSRRMDMNTANQYAGSLFDVARMATNLPGVVSSRDDRNDIIIRGNSPSGLIWRINDMDVPNPNHFGGLGVTGGPVSILNNLSIENTAFYTSSFPAEFGNGTSGVFDIMMKKGNTEKREHIFQIGFNGFELGTQGYFKKGSRSSYLISARISLFQVFNTVGLLQDPKDFVPKYSDITAKFDFPIGKRNLISTFFIGGLNQIDLLASPFDDTNKDDIQSSIGYNTDVYNKGGLYIAGLTYKHYLSTKTFFKIILGATGQSFNSNLSSVTRDLNNNNKSISIQDSISQQLDQNNIQSHFYINTKLSSNSRFKAGMIATGLYSKYVTELYYLTSIAPVVKAGPNFEGNPSTLIKWYASWKRRFKNKLDVNVGVHGMYLDLADVYSPVEPRVGVKYDINSKHSIGLGYGYHSQMQPITTYFFKDTNSTKLSVNKLDFTKSHQFVISYTWKLNSYTTLNLESYYQAISNVPIDQDSTFSMLNVGADFSIPVVNGLINSGKGTNMGLELSINRNISKGIYYLLSASLFKSTFENYEGKVYPTSFDNRFVLNALFGKEWRLFKDKIIVSTSARFVYAGGRPYTDVLPQPASSSYLAIYDRANTNGKRIADYYRLDIRASLKMQLFEKFAQEFIFEFINVTNHRNAWFPDFNNQTNMINVSKQSPFTFVMFYRLYF